MSIGLSISITDLATPVLAAKAAAIKPARLLTVGLGAVEVLTRNHFLKRNRSQPNKLGGTRTEYWRKAANSLSRRVETDRAVLSINQPGVRLAVMGGTVRAGQNGSGKKLLTIPVHPAAHGKTAGEFGNLERVFDHEGNLVALARPSPGRRFGEILFALKPQITRRPDPTAMPTQQAYDEAAVRAVTNTINRAGRRAAAKPDASAK